MTRLDGLRTTRGHAEWTILPLLIAGGWSYEGVFTTPEWILSDWFRDRGEDEIADSLAADVAKAARQNHRGVRQMTIEEAVEMMRKFPYCTQTMMAMADVWEENESIDVRCDQCFGLGVVDGAGWAFECSKCNGAKFVSNGNSLRAEALRLLGELGIVESVCLEPLQYGGGYYYWSIRGKDATERICDAWWDQARGKNWERAVEMMAGVVPARLAVMNAWAEATPGQRVEWEAKTRAITADPCTATRHG